MHILICGAGRSGRFLIEYLSQQNNTVTVIDQDEQAIESLNEKYDVQGFTGMATNPDMLKQAGAEDADVLIAMTDNDEQNLIICQMANMLYNIPIKICRLRRMSYLESRSSKLFSVEALNVDFVFSLEQLLMHKILRCLTYPGIMDSIVLSKDYLVIGLKPLDGSSVVNKSLEHSLEDTDLYYRITGVIRSNKWIIPKKQSLLQIKDVVYFIGHKDTIEEDLKYFGHYQSNVSRLLFVGDKSFLRPLVNELENIGKTYILRVVESNPSVARMMAEISDQITVVIGDLVKNQTFLEEQIQYAEAVISVTHQDEKNAVISLITKQLDNKTLTFSLMNYLNLPQLSDALDINVTLSPRQELLSSILKYTRTGFYKSISSLQNGLLEFWEFQVTQNSYLNGMHSDYFEKFKTFHLCGIIRGNALKILDQPIQIQTQDILLFMVNKNNVTELEKKLNA